jgi:hypothetical protein
MHTFQFLKILSRSKVDGCGRPPAGWGSGTGATTIDFFANRFRAKVYYLSNRSEAYKTIA